MSCRDWEVLLQQHLDGERPREALDDHFAGCHECAAEEAVVHRLLAGLGALKAAKPPADLAERIAQQVLSEPRRVPPRRWWLAASVLCLATAAAILIAVTLWPAKPQVARTPEPEPEPLRESVEQAGSAVASLTSRTASETVDRSAALLPRVDPDVVVPMSATIDPPLEPFREATRGVSSGFAPVADSARRAVGLFLRDLPGGPADKDLE